MAHTKISGEVIGIDLGTTYSCVAVARKGRNVEIIANDQGNRTTPSYVAFSPASAGSERLIGEAAKNQATLNPGRTIFDVKRLIGKKFDDPEVQKDLKYLPYPVVESDGRPCVEMDVNGQLKTFTPEELSAMVLVKMKETAEAYLGKQVKHAVVTVPAYFNDLQRQATKDSRRKRNILVYDLGGGTFDVSVLNIDKDEFRVLATGGDTHLGGGDFDQRVMKYFVDMIKRKYKKDVSKDRKALGKLRRECERAKRVLSSQTQVRVEIDSFIQGMDFSEPLTRARFEDLNSDLFERTLEVVKSTMEDANVEKDEIDEIVLVGGSTRIPKVTEMLKKAFNGKEPSKGINPDEAVAYGAAVQGAMLSSDQEGEFVGVVLVDVTPLSLGVQALGGLMSVVMPRNTVIPRKITRGRYTTFADQQTSMFIQVFQGERPLTMDCIHLGSFVLGDIAPAPRGVPSVEVTFEVDADGILTVTAKDTASKNSGSLTISSSKRNLSQSEVERMTTEAIEMAEHDKKEKARIDARNCLEKHIYDLNKAIDEKLNVCDKAEAKTALTEASEWLDDNQDAWEEDYEDRIQVLRDLWARTW
ncbi:unnamed protein product [Linum tenue]|uniref:Uncharacterized protein n=1 Tax=Linum tenue TaxID=586396 RepID=A0AAV0N581_9ROSI|nr:unnamed protein product [Linum tenue]